MRKTLHSAHCTAELNTDVCTPYDNAELTLTISIAMRPISPVGAEGKLVDSEEHPRRIQRWKTSEWTRWLHEFKTSGERHWSGKFWLINRFPTLEHTLHGKTYRSNVWCRLKLDVFEAPPVGPVRAHHLIDVVYLHPSEARFRSEAHTYDNRDIIQTFKQKDSHGRAITQRPHIHEIGHLLGHQHVDVGKPHCPILSDTNAKQCYGVADVDKRNVMGTGMLMTPRLARPWQRTMCRMTGHGNPRSPDDWEVKLVRHYPRTLDEAQAGRSITSRPARA